MIKKDLFIATLIKRLDPDTARKVEQIWNELDKDLPTDLKARFVGRTAKEENLTYAEATNKLREQGFIR